MPIVCVAFLRNEPARDPVGNVVERLDRLSSTRCRVCRVSLCAFIDDTATCGHRRNARATSASSTAHATLLWPFHSGFVR